MTNSVDQDLTIIIGAGIVGSSLACFLSESTPQINILVLDRSLSTIAGSTGYAPGFIGQYNEKSSLTKLAIDIYGCRDQNVGFKIGLFANQHTTPLWIDTF
ncbi:hypothetical protein KCU95_g1275, partial [Aureobasidium melanogenum]